MIYHIPSSPVALIGILPLLPGPTTTGAFAFSPRAVHRQQYRTTPLQAETRIRDAPSNTIPQVQHRDSFDRESWLNGFTSAHDEVCYELPSSADFPPDLEGTFFQNGHAKFRVGEEIVLHPFDADGMVSAVTFRNGTAWFRNRFVETRGFLDETKANKVLYRGVFGTAKNQGKWWSNIFDVKFKNVANTHVLYRKGDQRLFALWEAGLPHELDPVTLETLGETDWEGTLGDLKQYAAHYKMDPTTGTICNFVVGPGKNDPLKEHTLHVMEHDPHGQLLYRASHVFPRVGLNHDCAITDNYFVFFQSPARIDPLPFVLGQKGVGQCFEFDNDAASSKLVLVPRGKAGSPIEIDIPRTFTFHTANAFEDPVDGTVVVDTVIADTMLMTTDGNDGYPDRPIWETTDLQGGMIPYQLRRIRVDPSHNSGGSFVSQQEMTAAAKTVEFPTVHPAYVGKPYRYVYCGGSPSDTVMSPIQAVCKVDVVQGEIIQKWLPEPQCFVSELSFVPRSSSSSQNERVEDEDEDEEEDDGYLVGYMMDGKERTSSLVIFDAKDVAQGPIKTCRLKAFIPHALHGTFVPGLVPELTEEVAAAYPPKRS